MIEFWLQGDENMLLLKQKQKCSISIISFLISSVHYISCKYHEVLFPL